MERKVLGWKVSDLRASFPGIEFPEYQREPHLWDRDAKQKLIDSIMRSFDIASIYFYCRSDGVLECIDGRQRLNAIMAFLGENPSDEHDNGFPYKLQSEVFEETEHPFQPLNGMSFEELDRLRNQQGTLQAIAQKAVSRFWDYRITVIELSEATRADEFNLQFLRLNLGVLVNAGEKLKAMVGKMRDLLFGEEGLGKHALLQLVEIPTRRYAKEVVAAQILCQAFSFRETQGFTRVRHFDLQRFVKQHAEIRLDHEIVEEIRRTLDWLEKGLRDEEPLLRNRAITVSVVLLAWIERLFEDEEVLATFVGFLKAFLSRLHEQIEKLRDLKVDTEYRYLIDFQRDVTQAAVEKPAVKRRHDVLAAEWRRWRKSGRLRGDKE